MQFRQLEKGNKFYILVISSFKIMEETGTIFQDIFGN